jgi:hypothetical protein
VFAATFEGIPRADRFKIHAGTNECSGNELADPKFAPLPRFWVPKSEVENRLPKGTCTVLGFRNAISAVADSRSLAACFLPPAGVGNSLPLVLTNQSVRKNLCLIAALNSYVLDFVVRQKASGGNLNFYIFEQLPIPAPDIFDRLCPWDHSQTVESWLSARVLELTCTSEDLTGLAKQCGVSKPFAWKSERRLALKCELDAAMFLLYNQSHADMEHILNAFPVQKRLEEREYGSFRSASMVLDICERMAHAVQNGSPYTNLTLVAEGAC